MANREHTFQSEGERRQDWWNYSKRTPLELSFFANDQAAFQAAEQRGFSCSTRQYSECRKELVTLRNFLQSQGFSAAMNFADFEQLMLQKVEIVRSLAASLGKPVPEHPGFTAEVIAQSNAVDMCHFVQGVLNSASWLVDAQARWVVSPRARELYKFPGQAHWELLRVSRSLHTRPLSTYRRMGEQRVVGVGASVGSGILSELVSAGVNTVRVYDSDSIGASNTPRLLPGQGASTLGHSKVDVLVDLLLDANPYGDYSGVRARVSGNSGENAARDTVAVQDVIEQSQPTILVEAVDSFPDKLALRKSLAQANWQGLLVFPADLIPFPVVGIEQPSHGKLFNREVAPQEWDQLLAGIVEQQDAALKMLAVLHALYTVHEPDVSHQQLQAILWNVLGAQSFLSQPPHGPRELGIMTVKLLELHLAGHAVAGRMFTHQDIEQVRREVAEQQDLSAIAELLRVLLR